MATVKERIAQILENIDLGQGVLLACMPDADGKEDAYSLQCIGNRPGSRLKTDGEVRMAGYGVFLVRVEGGDSRKSEVSFCGGGAMSNIVGTDDDHPGFYLSYTYLGANAAQLARMGYDHDVQRRYLLALLASLD